MKVFVLTVPRAFLILIVPIMTVDGFAEQVTLSAVADTSIFENHPDSNLGGTTLVAGTNQQYSKSRALFRFDLSGLPIGATITQVHVTLHVTRRPDPDQHGGPVDSDFSLFRVLADWGEGSGGEVTGSNAQPGDATWNEQHFSSVSWGTPGGLVATDYANDPSATTSVGGIGSYLWGSSTELIADTQAWLDDPAVNFGFILISQTEGTAGTGRRFASREQPGGGIPAPQLELTYSIPEPAPLALATMCLLGLGARRRGPRRKRDGHENLQAPNHA